MYFEHIYHWTELFAVISKMFFIETYRQS